jgi:hypothetical protein
MPTTKHRIAPTLTDAEFDDLAAMADKYDVSLAWLGRKAILEFIARYRTEQLQLPLRSEVRPGRAGAGDHAT